MTYDIITTVERRMKARTDAVGRTRSGRALLALGRVLAAILLVLGAAGIAGLALLGLTRALGIDPMTSAPVGFLGGLVGTVAVIGGYVAYVRVFEARVVDEFGPRGAPRESALGALLGAALFSGAVGIVWLAGGYRVTGTNPWLIVVPAITGAAFWATLEEVVYRGVLLRIVEEYVGTWPALAVSSLAFAGFHLVATPNATLWTTVSIFVAGLWLGGAYLYTRRLWFPIALHAAWNFTQGAVFGIAVSGDEAGRGLLVGTTSGPTWLSGGAYGLEGSVVAVALVLLASVVVLGAARRKGHVVGSSRRPVPARTDA